MARNFVFLLHAALAAVAAFFLVWFPNGFARMAMGQGWNPLSPMAGPAVAFARMAGVGAILVVLVSSIARHSASDRVRWAARIAVLVLSILMVMAAVATFVPFQPLGLVMLAVNLLFAAAYLVGGVAPPQPFFVWNPSPPARFLDALYVIHAALAALFAFVLLLYPAWFTDKAMGVPWTAGTMAEIALTFARPAAVGAILVVLSTLLAVRAASVRVRWAALLAMLAISLAALLLACLIPPLMIAILIVHGALAIAYILIDILRPQEI